MKDKNKIFNTILSSKQYPDNVDLRFDTKYGFLLDRDELENFLEFKDNIKSVSKIDLPLKSFNSKGVYYILSKELVGNIMDYLDIVASDVHNYSKIVNSTYDEITLSHVLSEIEGSLKIEGVNTTRREVQHVIETQEIKNNNDRIILNMYNGIQFITKTPDFNKDNLKMLYELLSDGCLLEKDILGEKKYRDGPVYIGNHECCPFDKIDECMDSLFEYINNSNGDLIYNFLKPFIAHYYFVYIHPYFDYNGRTARMIETWIINNTPLSSAPLFLSEAINDNKKKYYKAIEKTRYSHNDLTYFLIYMTEYAKKYYLAYKKVNDVREKLNRNGEQVAPIIYHYYKKILVCDLDWFAWGMLRDSANLGDVSKQAVLKNLNKLQELGILQSKKNSSGEKIFKLNDNF